MPGFFQTADDKNGLTPLEGFPVELREGTLSAVVSTDELSSVIFLHSLLAGAGGKAYVIAQGRRVSPRLIERLDGDPAGVLVGFAYSSGELITGLSQIPPGSLLVVSDFPYIRGVGNDAVLEIRRMTDKKGLITVLHHEAMTFNELNPEGEFERLFYAPGLFDLLLVLRTSSYRGHYRLNITILKAPPEDFLAVGDHSIPVDGLLRKLKGQAP